MSSIVLLSTLLIVTVSNSNASGPSQGCSLAPNDETSGLHWFEVTVPDPYQGEVRRSYDVYVPASYDSEATPVLLDFHGYTANADIQFTLFPWRIVADEESFIYVAMNGMNDVNGLGLHGSWNCSSNEGPLGITCDLDVLGEFPCYRSCAGPSGEDCSYLENSCDWSSCHDDVVYTEVVLQDILDRFCIDTDSIHVSGMSNGGMFIWSRILERMTSTFASVGPVCSAPLRGFNPMPEFPISIIDFHGLQDSIIPMSPDAPADRGPGPNNTTLSIDGFYYHQKLDHLEQITREMHCEASPVPYPTPMDGEEGWVCQLWAGCDGGNEVVQCQGDYGHGYPFWPLRGAEGLRIMWDFMKRHPRSKE